MGISSSCIFSHIGCKGQVKPHHYLVRDLDDERKSSSGIDAAEKVQMVSSIDECLDIGGFPANGPKGILCEIDAELLHYYSDTDATDDDDIDAVTLDGFVPIPLRNDFNTTAEIIPRSIEGSSSTPNHLGTAPRPNAVIGIIALSTTLGFIIARMLKVRKNSKRSKGVNTDTVLENGVYEDDTNEESTLGELDVNIEEISKMGLCNGHSRISRFTRFI